MDFIKLAEERSSVRKFSDRQVEQDKLDLILRAEQVAPTARNLQPQRVYVLQSHEALEKLQKCKKTHYGETLAILICVDTKACWKRGYDGKPSGEIDAAIVTTHMMLEAQELGVGSTWVMNFDPEAVRAEFEIPDHEESVSLLVMGYAAADAEPSEFHMQKKDLKETVTVL